MLSSFDLRPLPPSLSLGDPTVSINNNAMASPSAQGLRKRSTATHSNLDSNAPQSPPQEPIKEPDGPFGKTPDGTGQYTAPPPPPLSTMYQSPLITPLYSIILPESIASWQQRLVLPPPRHHLPACWRLFELTLATRFARTAVFRIPQTHNMLSSLFDPRLPKSVSTSSPPSGRYLGGGPQLTRRDARRAPLSPELQHIDILTLALLALQVILFCTLPLQVSRYFFLAYFAGWRLAYNCGLGYVLKQQSEHKWIVRTVIKHGWMDAEKRPQVYQWIASELKAKMGNDYAFEVSGGRRSFGTSRARQRPLFPQC